MTRIDHKPIATPRALQTTTTTTPVTPATTTTVGPGLEQSIAHGESVGHDTEAFRHAIEVPHATTQRSEGARSVFAQQMGGGAVASTRELHDQAMAILAGRSGAALAPVLDALAQRGHLDDADRFGMTLAMHAAARGNVDVLRALVEHGASLDARTPSGGTVLHFGAASGGAEVFRLVLEQDPALFAELVNARVGSNGHTVAMEAVFNRNAAGVELLVELDRSGRVDVDFETPAVTGWAPQTLAFRDNARATTGAPLGDLLPAPSVPADAAVLAAYVDARRAGDAAPSPWIPAFQSAADRAWAASFPEGSAERARADVGLRLFDAIRGTDNGGVPDANAVRALLAELSPDDARALGNASIGGLQLTGLTLLFQRGDLQAAANATPEQAFAARARMDGALAIQRLLLDAGASPLTRERGLMQVPAGFREAVFGYVDGLRALLDALPVADRQTFLDDQGPLNGYTKLMDAALRNNASVIRFLVEAGASLDLVAHNGETAADIARRVGLPADVQALLAPRG